MARFSSSSMNGLYSTMMAQVPYADDGSTPLSFWAKKYRTAYGDAPTVFSAYGYIIIDRLATALQKNGPRLTTDSLAKTLETMTVPADMFGMPAMRWSPTSHLATTDARLSQIQNGKWKVVLDYDAMK